MKYIRTKDGIYSKLKSDIEYCDDYVLTAQRGLVKKCNVVKQADTIKELCDEFVLKGTDIIIIFLYKEHTQYRFEGSDEWFDITDVELRTGIYGAIWTDKGLIYVAKMNNKGELELIKEW